MPGLGLAFPESLFDSIKVVIPKNRGDFKGYASNCSEVNQESFGLPVYASIPVL